MEAGRRNAGLDTMLRVADALEVPIGLLLDLELDKTHKRLKSLLQGEAGAASRGTETAPPRDTLPNRVNMAWSVQVSDPNRDDGHRGVGAARKQLAQHG